MTDKKISQLSDATAPLAGTEVLPIVQSGSTVKVSVANLTAGRTVDATTVNATTVDATNVEVTNLKAKDGTAAVTIADSTGAVTVSSGSTLNGGVVVNEVGANVDFRVESATDANLLFADASADAVGIGTNTPSDKLQIVGGTALIGTSTGSAFNPNSLLRLQATTGVPAYIQIKSDNDQDCRIIFGDTDDARRGEIVFDHATDDMAFLTGNSDEAMRIISAGDVGIGTSLPNAKLSVDGSAIFNDSGADVDFRVESDTNTHALFVDAGNSYVGVNNSAPGAAFDVIGDCIIVGSDPTLNKSQLGPSSSSGGGSVKIVKSLSIAAGTSGATILTITGVDSTRTAQVWEVTVNSQASGTTQADAQRSAKLAFMITTASGGVPVVNVISGYGWADTLSSNPSGGDRAPTALNLAVTVDGSNNVIVTMDVDNTVNSSNNVISVLAVGMGRRVNIANVS